MKKKAIGTRAKQAGFTLIELTAWIAVMMAAWVARVGTGGGSGLF